MRPYGEMFEMATEPVVINDNEVLVDAIETKSGKTACSHTIANLENCN